MAQEAKKEKETTALAVRRPSRLISKVEQDFERMIEELWKRPFPSFWPERWWPMRALTIEMPVLDVFEEKDDVIVQAELPGLTKEEIQVSVTDSTLTLRGEKKRKADVKEEDYYYHERAYGAFARTIELPAEVKADQVKALFKDGVLEIRLPKTEAAKKKSIQVKIE